MRLVLADDALLFREGLARLLVELGFEVAGQAADGQALMALVAELQPDVALVDIRMPPTFTDEGLRAAQEIGEAHPEVGVVVLSQYIESAYATRLLENGSAGRGYLLKDRVSDLDAFSESIRRVAQGGSVVDPAVVTALFGRARQASPLEDLTAREREILSMMAEGRSNTGIGERLFLSQRTVESHVRAIFRKLGLNASDDDRRVLAVLTYLQG